jgi:hypothetical protein
MTTTGREDPQRYARVGGALYVLLIVVGFWAVLFVRGPIIVAGDATATAHNIAASQSLWRAGIAADVAMHMCDVGVMLALYLLLRPVNRSLALLAVLFTLVQTAVAVVNKMALLIPLFLLGDAPYVKALTLGERDALAYICIRAHDYGFGLALIFFGMACIVEGYLIYTSGFLPRVLGILMLIAGPCYLLNSFALLLVPALASRLFPAVLLPAFVAEASLALWLVIKGVDVVRWRQAAGLAPGTLSNAP